MENIKVIMIGLSLLLNLFLISELKKQSTVNLSAFESISTRIQTLAKPGNESDKGITNTALMEIVNTVVREEVAKARPAVATGGADSAKVDQLQARLDGLQKKFTERAGSSSGRDEKERKLREEAQKLKQEIIAICSKR